MNTILHLADQLRENDRLEAERMAALTADYSRADRHEGEWFGGCACSSGKPHCDCGMWARHPGQHVLDAMPEDFDQGDSADAEVVAWLLKAFGVVVLALFSAWCIANYLALANV